MDESSQQNLPVSLFASVDRVRNGRKVGSDRVYLGVESGAGQVEAKFVGEVQGNLWAV